MWFARSVDRLQKFLYASNMSYRFVLLLAFVCCATHFGAADEAYGQMTIREVPLNHTTAWKKHVAMLQDTHSTQTVPPLRCFELAVPSASASRTTLPRDIVSSVSASRASLPADEVPLEWRDGIRRASSRHGVAEALLAAVLKAESNFNPYAVSPKGALGAMQIMPATGKELGLRNSFDPEENLDAGTSYLASLLREFPHMELALAAYNAGPAAVRRHGGLPPYEETRRYVARVLTLFNRYNDRLR